MSIIPAVQCPRPFAGARFTQLVSKSCYRTTNHNLKLLEFHNLREVHETGDAATHLLFTKHFTRARSFGSSFSISTVRGLRARPTPVAFASHLFEQGGISCATMLDLLVIPQFVTAAGCTPEATQLRCQITIPTLYSTCNLLPIRRHPPSTAHALSPQYPAPPFVPSYPASTHGLNFITFMV